MPTATCERCDEPLTKEEASNPHTDESWGIMCDECYQEHCEFECCRCLGFEHVDHQHDYVVVFDQVAGVASGIYRVVNTPYWFSDMFNCWLYASALERIRDIRGIENNIGYPCGHLCLECRPALGLKSRRHRKEAWEKQHGKIENSLD